MCPELGQLKSALKKKKPQVNSNKHTDITLYPEALALKELGFDEPCFGWHILRQGDVKRMFIAEKCLKQDIGLCLAPTYSQAFRFFREKYELYHIIHCPTKDVSVFTITGFDIPSIHSDVELKSYEEAELACLKKLIEIVKKPKKI